MATTALDILIRAKDEASTAFRNVESASKNLGSETTRTQSQLAAAGTSAESFGSKFKTAAKWIGGAIGAVGVEQFATKALEAFDLLEKSEKRLALGLHGIGQGKKELDPIIGWAKSFSIQTGISEGSLVDMTSKLVTMGGAFFKATGPSATGYITGLTEGMTNLAAATGKSASMLMRSLGPAIVNTPLKAIALLQKYGVLTTEQTNNLKALGATTNAQLNDMVKAGTITRQYADYVKGLSAAQRQQIATQTEIGALQGRYKNEAAATATPLEKLRNLWNQLELAGGKLISGVLGWLLENGQKLVDWYQGSTAGATRLRAIIATLGDVFVTLWNGVKSGVVILGEVVRWFTQGSAWAKTLLTVIGALAGVWGIYTLAIKAWEVATKIAAAAQAVFNAVLDANPIALIAIAVIAVAAVIIANWGKIKAVTLAVWGAIVDFFKKIPDFFKALPQAILEFLAGAPAMLGNWALELLGAAVRGLLAGAAALWSFFENIGPTILGFLSSIPGQLLKWGGELIILALKGLEMEVKVFWAFWTQLVPTILGLIGKGIAALGKWGLSLLHAVAHGIRAGAVAVYEFWRDFPKRILGFVVSLPDKLLHLGIEALKTMAHGIAEGAVAVWDFFRGLIPHVLDLLASLGNKLLSFGSNALHALARGAAEAAAAVWNFFRSVPGRIMGFFARAFSWLFNVGRAIIRGLWEGMKSEAENVFHWLGWLGEHMPSLKGPPEKDKKLLFGIGELIIGGLHAGLRSGFAAIPPFLQQVSTALQKGLTASLAGPGEMIGKSYVAGLRRSIGTAGLPAVKLPAPVIPPIPAVTGPMVAAFASLLGHPGSGGSSSPLEFPGLPRLATGGIATGTAFIAGEGAGPTFAGPGAEAVIPLNNRGLAILAEALRRSMTGLATGGVSVSTVVKTPRSDAQPVPNTIPGLSHLIGALVGLVNGLGVALKFPNMILNNALGPGVPTQGRISRPALARLGEAAPVAGVGSNERRSIQVSVDRKRWVEQSDFEIAYRGHD